MSSKVTKDRLEQDLADEITYGEAPKGITTNSGNNFTVTLDPPLPIGALIDGQPIIIKASAGSSAPTLNADSKGVLNILRLDGRAANLIADKWYTLRYNQVSNAYFVENEGGAYLELNKAITLPVDTIASLKAIDTTNLTDKVVCYVEGDGIWRFDKEATDTGNDKTIVTPTTGGGRWKAISQENAVYSASTPIKSTRIHSLPYDIVDSSFKEFELQGQTLQNYASNGDFANGTTSWSGMDCVLSTPIANKLTVTGNGTQAWFDAYTTTNLIYQANKKVCTRAKVRINDAVCQVIQILIINTAYNVNLAGITISSPVSGKWYDISDIVGSIMTLTGGIAGEKVKYAIRAQYATSAGASGKTIEIQDAMIFDLGTSASDLLYTKTAAEMRDIAPIYIEGLQDVTPQTIKSIGKNMADKTKVIPFWQCAVKQIDNGIIVTSTVAGSCYATLRAYLKPNTDYRISATSSRSSATTGGGLYVFADTVASNITLGGSPSILNPDFTFNSGIWTSVDILLYTGGVVGDIATFTNIQLEEGNTKSSYEQYRESVLETTVLRNLPSGVCDSQLQDGSVMQRVGIKVLEAADVDLFTGNTNIDVIVINKPLDASSYNIQMNTLDGAQRYSLPYFRSYGPIVGDTTAAIGTLGDNGPTNIYAAVPKGSYANAAAAKAAYVGKGLRYELKNAIRREAIGYGQLVNMPKGSLLINASALKTLPPKFRYVYPLNDKAASECKSVTITQLEKDVVGLRNSTGGKKNLLHNWDFRNPINQRGSLSTYTASQYTIDRWFLNANGTLNLNSGYITISGSSGSTELMQWVDIPYSVLAGKTITVSILLTDGNIVKGTATIPSTIPTGYTNILYISTSWGFLQYNFNTTHSNRTYMTIVVNNGSSVSVVAAKVELGNMSTLEYDAPVDAGNELTTCQRYAIELNPNSHPFTFVGTGYGDGTTLAYIFIPLPKTMFGPSSGGPTVPAVTKTGSWILRDQGGTTIAVTSIAVSYLAANGVMCTVNAASGITVGKFYVLLANSDTTARLLLSADL